MTILDLKTYFETTDNPKFFIEDVFSWRGCYDEVAFKPTLTGTREESLKQINLALTEIFDGWKGGEFSYNEYTTIHFENAERNCNDDALFNLFVNN